LYTVLGVTGAGVVGVGVGVGVGAGVGVGVTAGVVGDFGAVSVGVASGVVSGVMVIRGVAVASPAACSSIRATGVSLVTGLSSGCFINKNPPNPSVAIIPTMIKMNGIV
jgi:hypothetical protein